MPAFFRFIPALLALIFPSAGGTLQGQEDKPPVIKIGLLVNDIKSREAIQGAEIAVHTVNEKGGIGGRKIQLVVRSMEGPWGTGSKQTVDLVFNEEVLAIMGSHDGRNAHLVEQVCAKTRVVFLSAWASDPTLSQAFVPWYFSCVPNDLQQASSLINEIYQKRKLNKVAVIYTDDYDAKMAYNSFLKKTRSSGIAQPAKFHIDDPGLSGLSVISQLKKAGATGIVLFCSPPVSVRVIQQLRENNIHTPVFATLSLLNENVTANQSWLARENVIVPAQGNQNGYQGLAFRQIYRQAYGTLPGIVASYAFDGMNMLIETIRIAGPDRDKVQKVLLKMQYEGVTGHIQFDGMGNRSADN